MDRVQQRGKWKKKTSFYILCFVFCLPMCTAMAILETPQDSHHNQSEPCKEDEFKSQITGYCCNKCHPGFKLEAECRGQGMSSTCSKCPPETYQKQSNYARTCSRCRKCKTDSFEVELSTCQNVKDRECGCKHKYYMETIGINTQQCRACKTCGSGERLKRHCTPTSNAECECEPHHYRSDGVCVKCERSTDHEDCQELHQPTTPAVDPSGRPAPDSLTPWFLAVGVACLIAAFAVITGFMICGNRTKHEKPPESATVETVCSETLLPSAPAQKDLCRQESHSIPALYQIYSTDSRNLQAQLPDCVPKEIKTSHFIYFALDHIPAARFKELVRRLGVLEREIERAERDNHTFQESQYQMLKVWAEKGGGEGRGILSSCMLQELVETLRTMGLAGCAEVIEMKFPIQ
ncbi:tumor necrosis factor receptor superfamily member 1A [Megalops cyprinoides]|uniref:tumor necrosis factor receptor superfamily member 1A n=1 Tax=Megalops cyprinoides TaxID=118141 RepID=UPI001863D884|nr:tumor necrosis factor receptor superfamily member 1A [Megalops cyprinoides]XP_036394120.1 tumor necrosis factor receptor superfamily member 1A [Megalops cyprinoides]